MHDVDEASGGTASGYLLDGHYQLPRGATGAAVLLINPLTEQTYLRQPSMFSQGN